MLHEVTVTIGATSQIHRMVHEQGWIAIRTLVLFVVLTAVALFSGHILILLALSISAYELAIYPDEKENGLRRVFAGHVIATITGFVAYHVLAPGLSALQPPPGLSIADLRLAASGAAAMFISMFSMRMTNLYHYPAYATAVTFSIGILMSIEVVIATFAGVIALVVAQFLLTQMRSNANDSSVEHFQP